MTTLCKEDGEDRMGSGARLVHVGGSDSAREDSIRPQHEAQTQGNLPRLVALVNEIVYVLVIGNSQLGQILHIGTQEWMLTYT